MKKPTIIISCARSIGKTRHQNLTILKKWPTGVIAHVSVNCIRYSELADAEEIKYKK